MFFSLYNTGLGGGNVTVFRVRICNVVRAVVCALNIGDRAGLSCMLLIIVINLLDLNSFIIYSVISPLCTGFFAQDFWVLFGLVYSTTCSAVCALNIGDRAGLSRMLLVIVINLLDLNSFVEIE